MHLTFFSQAQKASYLDGDRLYKHGEKPNGWKPSDQRVKRGLIVQNFCWDTGKR